MNKLITTLAAAFFIFILWIIYLADTNSSSIFFDFIRSFPNGDKLGHICLFGTLTFGVVVASRFRTVSIGMLNIYYGSVFVAIFVIAEEITQAFIPSRTFDFIDLASDAVGIGIASYLAYVVNKHSSKCGKV